MTRIVTTAKCHVDDIVILDFIQYTHRSRWRRAAINRRDHHKEDNETEGIQLPRQVPLPQILETDEAVSGRVSLFWGIIFKDQLEAAFQQ